MQIFVLESTPLKAAQALCDKHVVSQVGETAQLLALAALRNGEQIPPVTSLVPSTRHLNHPCSKWVGETLSNYQWTYELAKYLCDEYRYRYKREHAYEKDIKLMLHPPFKLLNEAKGPTPAPAVVPEVFVNRNSIVHSYRSYYCFKASTMPMRWTSRHPPMWFM